MDNFVDLDVKNDNYFASITKQYNNIVNRPGIIAAYEKEAFINKWKSSSLMQKARLTLKKVTNKLGVKKSLLLGSYRSEEDLRQRLQDMEIYYDILQSRKKYQPEAQNVSEKQWVFTNKNERTHDIDWAENIKTLLSSSRSYIALMVENLDSGGLEEVVACLTAWFYKNNIEIKIFCTQNGGRIEKALQNNGIDVLVFHGKKKLFKNYLKNHPPLLINTHFVSDFYEIISQYHIPVVEVIHNMYLFLTDRQLKQERKKAKYITHYIAVSEMAKKIFICKMPQIDANKITVIGNAGALGRKTAPQCESFKKIIGFPEDAFIFLAVGSIDSRKNQIGIVRALDIVRYLINKPIVLILTGTVTDYEYNKKLNSIIAERNLQNNIIFEGYTEHILDIMNIADALIVDSYFEGWSMAATEALHCGLPIIHSDCGSGKELTAGGANGILIGNPISNIASLSSVELYDKMHMGINENIAELVTAMVSMFKNKETWKMRRPEIKKYAERNFTPYSMMQEYLRVYYKVCHVFIGN